MVSSQTKAIAFCCPFLDLFCRVQRQDYQGPVWCVGNGRCGGRGTGLPPASGRSSCLEKTTCRPSPPARATRWCAATPDHWDNGRKGLARLLSTRGVVVPCKPVPLRKR